MEPAPGDCGLSETLVGAYDLALDEGKLRVVTWASVTMKTSGMIYRVNGKHTSEMLWRRLQDGRGMGTIYINLEEYSADSLQDVADLYSTFDSKMSARTSCDIIRAYAGAVASLRDIPDRILGLIVGGVAGVQFGAKSKEIRTVAKASLVLENEAFALWARELTAIKATAKTKGEIHPCRKLLRMPVFEMLYRTWLVCPEAAGRFWRAVRDESDPDHESPTRVLARWLGHTCLLARDARTAKAAVTNSEMAYKCAQAWNLWRDGKTGKLQHRRNQEGLIELPKLR
jgi:hypothetical protein